MEFFNTTLNKGSVFLFHPTAGAPSSKTESGAKLPSLSLCKGGLIALIFTITLGEANGKTVAS
jgi:hypothetical protein